MTPHDLIQGLGITVAASAGADAELTDITDDSRRATAGCLFIARAGAKTDGRTYVDDAVARGAAAVLVETGLTPPPAAADMTWLTTPRIDNALVGELAERFFGRPSGRLKLVGITGTKGKTTTAFVIQHLLRRAGVKTGMIGTVVIDDGDTRTPADLTTPGAIDFSRHLAAMVDRGCTAAVAEVSSHALHQGRTAALHFDVGVFTNLTGDHLDYHGTMEAYAESKAILFAGLGPEAWAVFNNEDPWAPRMRRDCAARMIDCAVDADPAAAEADSSSRRSCRATILGLGADHSRVRFEGPWGSFEVRLPLVGRHNVANVLQAVAGANCVTALSRTLRDSLEACPAPPGRLEPVRLHLADSEAATDVAPAGLPTVLVDYAHTHDALEKALEAVRPLTHGRLIVVFGCGGDRDRTKRPKMAAVACRLADAVVVTSDNPRTEDPRAIINEVLAGLPAGVRPEAGLAVVASPRGGVPAPPRLAESGLGPRVIVEPDRARAIALAIAAAGESDLVLIAGKGHEDYQIVGTTKRHFDDREEAAKALRRRAGGAELPLAS